MAFKNVLVPLDGSILAEHALATAFDLARDGATLLLMRAAEASTMPGADQSEMQVAVVREAEEYLADMAARLERAGIAHVETSVWYGPAASTIAEAAERRNADLIVMSTHGRSGLGRLVLGSVTESVLRCSKTPMLLVHGSNMPVTFPRESMTGVAYV